MRRVMVGLILLLSLLAGGVLAAQELTGRITGTVTDQQKAVIPGASVVATHVATNTVYRATTTQAGRFTIPNVRLGRYSVAVEAQGFSRGVVRDVHVEVGGTADINVTLQVGTLQEEVVVTAEASQEIVNTVDAELGAVVDERRVLELPLDGRNASQLALIQAGVFYEADADGMGDKFIVHGQRHRSVNISLDGIDTQDNLNRASSIMINQPLLALAAENIQEFRVATGNSSSEFTRGGVQITAVTRSGTNDYHGSVFWFHRNDVFNANEFFNNSIGAAVPKLLRHQFGGRIGGPIVRDKTFFFFGYQQTRESRGIPVNRTVYTAEARQGIFRYLDNMLNTPENVAANPGLIRSVNLLECSANIQSALGRFCVDGRFDSVNPASMDPFITGQLFAAIPLPNNTLFGDGLNTGGFRFNARAKTTEHLPSFRFDQRITEKHNFTATFNYVDRNIAGDFINGREPRYPNLGPLGNRVTHSRGFSAALTSTLAPTFINEARFGVLAGENAFIRNQPFGITDFTLDLNDITDPFEPGGGASVRDNETWHVRDSFTWVKGSHTIKAGGEWRHRWLHNYSFFESAPFGEIDFNRDDNTAGFSESNLRALSGGTDIESTDFNNARDLINNLVGAIGEVEMTYNVESLQSGFVLGAPERHLWRVREFDWFVNDTWAARPNLTFTLGLRWEFATIPFETRGLALIPEGGEDAVFGISGRSGFFNPGVLAGSPCSIPTLAVPLRTDVENLITSCATPYVLGGSNNGLPFWDKDWNNFGPVIGLAWDPLSDGKTSIRAGFRLSYMQDHFAIVHSNVDDNEGLSVDQDCAPVAQGDCINNVSLLRDVMAGAQAVAPVPAFTLPVSRSILDSTAQDFRTYIKDLETPYYEEWNLSFSREFLPNTAIEVRYVGNHGVKLRRVADFNEINIFARDSVTGQTFLDAFLIAQQNLACNRTSGLSSFGFSDASGASCITPNPLMAALIAGDPTRLDSRSSLLNALDFNEPGEFVYRLTQRESSRPDTSVSSSSANRVRGGSFWGQVLRGRFPANFFHTNPFVHSSRAMVNDGFSKYHAVEIELRRRYSRGLMLQVNYTYGKALADYDGDENTLLNDVRPSSVRNPRYMTQEIMPRHQYNANWIWEIPVGPGRALAPESGVARKALGGWQVGGIISGRSGRPFTIRSGVGTFHRSAISDSNTVNLSQPMSNSELRDLVGKRTIGGEIFWWDPCLSAIVGGTCSDSQSVPGLFTLPDPGQLGELQQTPVFGPRRFTFDLNFAKQTQVTETVNMEFRWEIFNVFNHANFGIPSTDIFSSNFGRVTRTIGNPRLMQFALKVNF